MYPDDDFKGYVDGMGSNLGLHGAYVEVEGHR